MILRGFALAAALFAWAVPARALPQDVPAGYELVRKVFVAAATPWTDTEIEVRQGEEFLFRASGSVSLQKDNPIAGCGPDGMKLQTMRQPLPERNLGALIGRVRDRVEIVEDKQTKEKTTREFGEAFFIGAEGLFTAAVSGRLQLGVNDNLSTDNDGGFEVLIFRRKPAR